MFLQSGRNSLWYFSISQPTMCVSTESVRTTAPLSTLCAASRTRLKDPWLPSCQTWPSQNARLGGTRGDAPTTNARRQSKRSIVLSDSVVLTVKSCGCSYERIHSLSITRGNNSWDLSDITRPCFKADWRPNRVKQTALIITGKKTSQSTQIILINKGGAGLDFGQEFW